MREYIKIRTELLKISQILKLVKMKYLFATPLETWKFN